MVSGAKRLDINPPHFSGGGEIALAPAHAGLAKLGGEQVGGEAGMAAVAISKRVNEDEAVMKLRRDLVGRINLMLDPVPHVGHCWSHSRRGCSIRSRISRSRSL
jgi:hypothetical protein